MGMRILVATDGCEAAAGAIRVARRLAERLGAEAEIVSVVDPIPMHGIVYAGAVGAAGWQVEEAARDARAARVQEQMEEIGVDDWPLIVETGPPAPTIVRVAQKREATLIVLGLGRHGMADRWFGTETALRVVRLAHVPVLAVPASAESPPSVAVVGVDFTDFSLDAARTALALLPPGGVLNLVHAFWRPSEEVPWVGGRDWVELQRERVKAELRELAGTLAGTGGVTVRTHFRDGEAAGEALRVADQTRADLIAVGSHGAGFFGRLMMGSVSTRLLRGTDRMTLIAPPRTVPAELQEEGVGTPRRVLASSVFPSAPRVER